MRENNDLELLIDAAKNAGEIAAPYWRSDPKVWDKSDGAGPVTEADLAVDRMLHEYLLSERPSYGWLSEETVDTADRLSRDKVFIVDPIDGTRSFINGEKNWAHSLAIAENGQITAAVVFLPLREEIFIAAKGEGASLNEIQLSISRPEDIDGSHVIATKSSLSSQYWKQDAPDFRTSFRPSLAYRLSLVAAGQADAMLTFRNTWEWDVAAGSLIVEEAGGIVRDTVGAKPVFNQKTPILDGMIAGHAPLTNNILGQIKPRR